MNFLKLYTCAIFMATIATSPLLADEKPIETVNPDGSKHIIIKRPEQRQAEERFITNKGILKTRVIRHLNESGNFIRSEYYNEASHLYAYEVPEFSKEGPARSIKWMDKNKVLVYTINLYPNFNITSPDGTILTQDHIDAFNARLRAE